MNVLTLENADCENKILLKFLSNQNFHSRDIKKSCNQSSHMLGMLNYLLDTLDFYAAYFIYMYLHMLFQNICYHIIAFVYSA